ncbi:Mediator of RNA polymerase II transcription subunit 13 [Papilio xuthus]|uniref:Mediator of RNA polymerase II transcription subunit 13 n=1 Tax=Papilio xuthus TaxID=66420 RepID=A0A194QHK3_PAPXU|nr:Mediator of RNA polymerase II transcription subunit 13 [Papilio xuthus]
MRGISSRMQCVRVVTSRRRHAAGAGGGEVARRTRSSHCLQRERARRCRASSHFRDPHRCALRPSSGAPLFLGPLFPFPVVSASTELYGIKWRKLVWQRECGGGGGKGEEGAAPLGDPVISSYARCLAGDILCVWRRVPSQQSPDLYDMPAPPPLSLRAAKELWIFWYGEEPDLSGLVAPELIASQSNVARRGVGSVGDVRAAFDRRSPLPPTAGGNKRTVCNFPSLANQLAYKFR